MKKNLKVTIIGGSGLIGSRVAKLLRDAGHGVLTASRSSGVDLLTGAGLAEAFAGADVVVDVANSPSFEDEPVMHFFDNAGRNIAAAEVAAGVRHHVALGVVGTDRMQSSGYFRAKLVQEKHIQDSGIPYTIVRATQFFEFVEAIANSATEGQIVRLPSSHLQPIAADDVAAALAKVAQSEPVNATIELAGPEPIPLDELIRQFLRFTDDARTVVTDPSARYFGSEINNQTLTPGERPLSGATRFEDWLKANQVAV